MIEPFEDELARNNIDQLHKLVLQLSSNCFETKKLCATVIVGVATLVATFTGKELDISLWVGAAIVTMLFWILDAQSYYYQEKLRARMKILAETRARLHAPQITVDGVGMPLEERRETWNPWRRAIHAVCNPSMAFYWILLVLITIVATLHDLGLIHTLSK